MKQQPNIPWWASMGFRKPDAPVDTDYADMGTAFGLDASMVAGQELEPPPGGDAGPSTDRLNRRSVI